jgi:hypothetical protein
MRTLHKTSIVLLLLAMASVALGADEPYVSIFAGYAANDDSTGADRSVPFGVRFGVETPTAGGQFSLAFNRDGDVKMDTLMAELLFHFGATDVRTRRNRIIYNRVSGFATIGLGAMFYDAGRMDSTKTIFATNFGLGMQAKFTRKVGLRVQLQSLYTAPNNFRNYTGDVGLAFYF